MLWAIGSRFEARGKLPLKSRTVSNTNVCEPYQRSAHHPLRARLVMNPVCPYYAGGDLTDRAMICTIYRQDNYWWCIPVSSNSSATDAYCLAYQSVVYLLDRVLARSGLLRFHGFFTLRRRNLRHTSRCFSPHVLVSIIWSDWPYAVGTSRNGSTEEESWTLCAKNYFPSYHRELRNKSKRPVENCTRTTEEDFRGPPLIVERCLSSNQLPIESCCDGAVCPRFETTA